MTIRDLVVVLRREAVLILCVVIASLAVAAGYLQGQPKVYESDAEAYVSVGLSTSVGDLNQANAFTQQVVASLATVARSPLVLNSVARSIGAGEDAAALQSEVSVSVAPSTSILLISVKSTSSVQAATVANGLTASLNTVAQQLNPSSSAKTKVLVTQITRATPSIQPSSPMVPTTLAIALLAGLLLSVAIVALKTVLRTPVRSRRELEVAGLAPVLGEIPGVFRSREAEFWTKPPAGARRAARLLDVASRARGSYVVSVLSVGGRPGSGHAAEALARAFADSNRSVLLISRSRSGGTDGGEVASSDTAETIGLRRNRHRLAPAAVRSGVAHSFVSSDTVTATDLPSLFRFALSDVVGDGGDTEDQRPESDFPRLISALVGQARDAFDITVLDAGALENHPEALAAAASTDAAVVTVTARRTDVRLVGRALEVLHNAGAYPAGVLVLGMRGRGPDSPSAV